MPREPKWDEILAKLSKPPVVDGLCVDAENAICPARYQTPKGKFLPRPAWFEAFGCMRGDEVDKEAMSRTFDQIWNETNDGCQWLFWGCDFPMLAMTAARLGKTREALDIAAFGASQQRRSGQRFQSGRLDALSAGNRRPALGHRPHGCRLGGRPRQTRPRFPRRRELGGKVGGAEEGAMRRNEQRAAHPHHAHRSAAYAAQLALRR